MFVPVPNACGNALITIQALDNVITVDPGLYQRLADALGVIGTDHTYLKVGVFPYIEYIKVTEVSNIPNQLIILRGVDGTTPQVHAANTPVEYVLSHAAVLDTIAASSELSVQIIGEGNISVEQTGTNEFTLRSVAYEITSENQSIYVADMGQTSGDSPHYFDLAVNPEMFGMCRPADSGGGE